MDCRQATTHIGTDPWTTSVYIGNSGLASAAHSASGNLLALQPGAERRGLGYSHPGHPAAAHSARSADLAVVPQRTQARERGSREGRGRCPSAGKLGGRFQRWLQRQPAYSDDILAYPDSAPDPQCFLPAASAFAHGPPVQTHHQATAEYLTGASGRVYDGFLENYKHLLRE